MTWLGGKLLIKLIVVNNSKSGRFMVNDSIAFFKDGYKSFSNNDPYPWQIRLFELLVSGHIPDECSIPTGLGKTSVITIWVLALAWLSSESSHRLPRRLVYVVNRRTVVDQSTNVALEIVEKLSAPESQILSKISKALKKINIDNDQPPLVVSTLRGQMADNEEWKRNPAQPAIIVGTVDMIGSKLLFSGYGDGQWKRSFHAGLMGHDVLLIHDETHLSPAFHKLIKSISDFQDANPSNRLKSFGILGLSATPGNQEVNHRRIDLTDADRQMPAIRQRLFAEKRLNIHQAEKISDGKEIADKALAYEGIGVSVIIYVKTPALALKVFKSICVKAQGRACLLTGRMRGYERDSLEDNAVYQRFVKRAADNNGLETVYLVSTSAGEVGADFDADHGICDLSTIDSMIQRFGRINRSGGRVSNIDVYCEGSDKNLKNERETKTLELIKKLPQKEPDVFSASPDNVSRLTHLESYTDAATPMPYIRPLESYLLDTWACTSLLTSKNLPVSPWLHGLSDQEIPECWLVWRNDIPSFKDEIEKWLEAFPVKTREIAKLPVTEIIRQDGKPGAFLKSIQESIKGEDGFCNAVLVSSDNDLKLINLKEHASWKGADLDYGILILPCNIGGLDELSGQPDDKSLKIPAKDVAEEKGIRERYLLEKKDQSWIAKSNDDEARHEIESIESDFLSAVTSLEDTTGLKAKLIINRDVDINDRVHSAIIYLCGNYSMLPDGQDISSHNSYQLLDDHLSSVELKAELICKKLGLPELVTEALLLAAKYHDLGKNRRCWQSGLGNPNHATPLAKYPAGRGNWKLNHGYRHEVGSCLDLYKYNEVADHPLRDLILHLVSSHHGYSRPCFEDKGLSDPMHTYEENMSFKYESMIRFEKLQREYGWWGLAFLEALIKSADAIASKG